MKISAEKCDSGFNLSAVHCPFAIVKEMQQMCISLDVPRYETWIHLQNVVSYIVQQYSFLKVTNESDGLVRFESYSFSCFASLPSLPSLVLPLCQLVFCLSSSVRLSTCLYPGKRLEIRCQMTLALSCFFPI